MTTTLRFECRGTRPLIMHNPRLVDEEDPLYAAYTTLSRKRLKTIEQKRQLADMGWEAYIYTDAKGKLTIPAYCIKASVKAGAANFKMGTKVQETSEIIGDPVFTYKGSKNLEKLRDDPGFRLRQVIKVANAAVMRVWPKFAVWGMKFDIAFPETLIDVGIMVESVEFAGTFKGILGSHKRGWGRYEIVSWSEVS